MLIGCADPAVTLPYHRIAADPLDGAYGGGCGNVQTRLDTHDLMRIYGWRALVRPRTQEWQR